MCGRSWMLKIEARRATNRDYLDGFGPRAVDGQRDPKAAVDSDGSVPAEHIAGELGWAHVTL